MLEVGVDAFIMRYFNIWSQARKIDDAGEIYNTIILFGDILGWNSICCRATYG